MVGLLGLVIYFITAAAAVVAAEAAAAAVMIQNKFNYVMLLTFRTFSVVTGWFDRQTK